MRAEATEPLNDAHQSALAKLEVRGMRQTDRGERAGRGGRGEMSEAHEGRGARAEAEALMRRTGCGKDGAEARRGPAKR